MTDRKIKRVLLLLLRTGLWKTADACDICTLAPAQWLTLYRYAQKHTIEGLVFDGLCRLPAALRPPRELMLKWTVRVDQIERHNTRMAACIKAQQAIFHAQGIYPVLLKGHGVAACYDIPGHRISGDVDWYFEREKDYCRANELIRQHGIALSYTAGLSTEYLWQGIVVEHHKRMFDIHNPFSFPYLDRLQKQFHDTKVIREIQGNILTLPAPVLMMLQVNAHILKHLMSFGVGIRQLCDAARVYHSFQSAIDGQQLRQIYQRLGILNWIHLLHAVLIKYIGLLPQSLPFELPQDINAEWMMEEIWLSGNFGFYDVRYEADTRAAVTGRNQASHRISSNVRKYFQYAPMEAICFPLVQFISKFAAK